MGNRKADIFMRMGHFMRTPISSDCFGSQRRLTACLLCRHPLRGCCDPKTPTALVRFAARNQSSSPLAHLRSLGGLLFAGAARYARQGLCRPWTCTSSILNSLFTLSTFGKVASLCSLEFIYFGLLRSLKLISRGGRGYLC